MKPSTKILGGIALVSTLAFLFKSSRENEGDVNSQIEGLNVDIDTDKFINGMASKISQNPRARQAISNVAKRVVSGVIDKKMGV